MDSIIKQLEELKKTNARTNPDRSWVIENKKQLMARIKKDKEEISTVPGYTAFSTSIQAMNIFVSRRLVRSLRPVVMYMLIMAMVFGSWGIGVASAESIPGELLYKVKRAKEGVELALTTKPNKSQKRLEIVSKRIEEKKQIVRDLNVKEKVVEDESGEADKRLEALASLDKDIQKQLELAKENLDSDVQNKKETTNSATEQVGIVVDFNETVGILGDDLQNLKKEIKDVVERVKKETDDTTIDKINVEGVNNLEKAHEALEATINRVEIDSIGTAVQVAVVASQDGNKNITEQEKKDVIQEVVDLVSKKTTSLANDSKKTLQDVADVKENAEIGIENKGLIISGKEITTSVTTSQKTVAEVIGGAFDKASVGDVAAKEIIDGVKKDLFDQNLEEALKKLRQLQTSTQENKQILVNVKDEVNKAVEGVTKTKVEDAVVKENQEVIIVTKVEPVKL